MPDVPVAIQYVFVKQRVFVQPIPQEHVWIEEPFKFCKRKRRNYPVDDWENFSRTHLSIGTMPKGF